VWKANARLRLDQQFHQAGVVREAIDGPRLDLRQDAAVEVLNLKRRVCTLARTLT
jgi:hypothetical protein